ncbi:hypothetical protein KW786_01775 [Candidatus Parcubacteria bacterium]|nr:hypothetical protein [Candidatus Parcubacteria bacterium]
MPKQTVSGGNYLAIAVMACMTQVSLLACCAALWEASHSPPPDEFVIELPKFKGRVVGRSKVTAPTTLAVEEAFDHVSEWEGGVLSYGVAQSRDYVILEAWSSHPDKNGVTRYASKHIEIPQQWKGNYCVYGLEKKADLLQVTPKKQSGMMGVAALMFLFFLCSVFLLGCALYTCAQASREER